MDTTNTSEFSIVPSLLASQLKSNSAPLIIDVRRREAYEISDIIVDGALRRDPAEVDSWAKDLSKSTPVCVYCVRGHEVSQNAMRILRAHGIAATYLAGGIEAWRAEDLPIQSKTSGHSNKWVTRARPKIDRIACPWLVLRFIDASAEFLYVPTDQVAKVAQTQNATAYDVTPQVCTTPFTHDGEMCSFDAFIKHYRLDQNQALMCLARTVRAADTDRLDTAPQASGLLAVSLGMSAMYADDQSMLQAMLPIYDALYAWCVASVAGTDERHNWKPE